MHMSRVLINTHKVSDTYSKMAQSATGKDARKRLRASQQRRLCFDDFLTGVRIHFVSIDGQIVDRGYYERFILLNTYPIPS